MNISPARALLEQLLSSPSPPSSADRTPGLLSTPGGLIIDVDSSGSDASVERNRDTTDSSLGLEEECTVKRDDSAAGKCGSDELEKALRDALSNIEVGLTLA